MVMLLLMVRVGALSQPRGGERTASGGSAPRCAALSRAQRPTARRPGLVPGRNGLCARHM
jgi:hypothetical protein